MATPLPIEPVREDERVAPRRSLLKASLAGGIAMLGLPLAARAAAPDGSSPMGETVAAPALPVVDARFPAEMAPGVFVVPDRRIFLVPNIGIVVGRDAVLVIDSGLEPESGTDVLKLARRLAPGRRVILTVTHGHPEHGFGAQAFKGAGRIFYNAAQRDYVLRSGAALLEGFRTRFLPPEQKHLLDGVTLTPADQVYAGTRASLDLGGRTVRLRTWGTAHTPGDQIAYLPAERIVFSGDLIEERAFPIVPFYPPMIGKQDIDVARWETALHDIVALQPRLIVPGHGNMGGPEIAANVLAYFKAARASARPGVPRDDAADQALRARFPDWEHSQFIPPARRYLAQS